MEVVHYLIICRSLTYAQRTAKILERAGISAIVMKAPAGLSDKGCTYCVKISERWLSQALTALDTAGMSYGKVYISRGDINTEVQL